MQRHLALLLVIALLAAACGGDDDTPEAAERPSPAPTAVPATEEAPPPTPAPSPTAPEPSDPTPPEAPVADTAAAAIDDHLAWFVERLADPATLTREDIEARFAASFLAEIPVEAIIASTPQIVAGTEGPYTLADLEVDEASNAAAAVVQPAVGGPLDLIIAVEPTQPRRIIGLSVTPALTVPTSASEVESTLAALAPQATAGLYDVTDGECAALEEIGSTDPFPIGSAFKLWVLAELAHQVELGDAAWDEPLTVTAEHRSSPDGEVFTLGDGETLTLREHAELMISISDNTATDHLMARLGRANIEAALDRIGVETVEPNTPMLSTGALFLLKFIADEPNAADWRALDVAGRRALLEEIDGAVLPWVERPVTEFLTNADGVAIDQPRDLDLEWFATPLDLCLTLVHLAELAERPGLEPVAEILEINPGSGIPFDRDQWPTIRFKGGSEPGVVAGAWWFESADGRRVVLVGGASDPDAPLDEASAITTIAGTIALAN